ncbi:hypothetical protein [Sporosarcina sp. FSL K6-5500]|uniref:hypothetical protein n=1 Tax=Sporosarcina sp. FSL K6-5500 TaxID=2921558 RepID=UPI0030F62FFD
MIEDTMQDEKVQQVLAMLEEGQTREDIAAHYEQGWQAVDMYMRRRGFSWGKQEQTYIIKQEDEPTKAIEQASVQNTRAAQIVRMLDVKHPNIRQTTSKQGFETVVDMGAYMKSQGYVWDNELNNYRYDELSRPVAVATNVRETTSTLPIGAMGQEALLHYLLQHQQKLIDLLHSTDNGKLPTYTFKGSKVSKTVGMASTVDVLLSDYSKEFNVTQRAIIETALAEFFQRYGYEEQLQQAVT